MSKQIAPFKALYWIVLSIVCISGSVAVGLHFFMKWYHKQQTDPKYYITHIIQTGPQKNALSSEYLSEIMALSADKPSHQLHFDIKRAQRALQSSPLIKTATVRLIKPNVIYVDLSNAYAPTLGSREIVLYIEDDC